VSVVDTEGTPKEGLNVYTFDGTTYTSYNDVTDVAGQVSFTLPSGSYRFRADLEGTQFWSDEINHCTLPGCETASVTVTKPVTVSVADTDAVPQIGLNVFAFDDGAYTGFNGTTDASGEVSFILPEGDYCFRADTGGTQFWSELTDHCALPGCESASVTVTIPVTVTVASQNGDPYPDLNVYAFDGESYIGHTGVSDENGEVVFTLPEGDYRFRADYNGVEFWSDAANHCALPGCTEVTVDIPGGLGTTELTIDYTYDPLYRLTAADYDDDDGTFFHYSYDAVGNRLTQDTLAGTNAYVYDIANRLTNVDGVSYTWDNNGNLLTDGISTFTYNYANMLASVNQGGVIYDYLYSGLGDRLQQAIDGVTTNYTLDINTGLTQVLADGTHTYLYGQGRIAQVGTTNEYFLGDVLSSVRQLTVDTAVVTLTRSYEVFGSVMTSEGNGESVFQFTGEVRDGNNLTFLRARYMSSVLGRFISKDPWVGNMTKPASFNGWSYGYGNPVRYSDPAGLFPCENCVHFRSNTMRRWCLENCCGTNRYDYFMYEEEETTRAEEIWKGFTGECDSNCAYFVSTVLQEYGLEIDKPYWQPSCENAHWSNAAFLFKYLTENRGYKAIQLPYIPTKDIRLPEGTPIFYNDGSSYTPEKFVSAANFEEPYRFNHVAIVAGHVYGPSGRIVPSVLDVSNDFAPEKHRYNHISSIQRIWAVFINSNNPIY